MKLEDLKKKYGETMSVENMSVLFKLQPASIRTNICRRCFPVKTYKISGRILANTEDVFQAIKNAQKKQG